MKMLATSRILKNRYFQRKQKSDGGNDAIKHFSLSKTKCSY